MLAGDENSLDVSICVISVNFNRAYVIVVARIVPCAMFFIRARITRLCQRRMFRLYLPSALIPRVFNGTRRQEDDVTMRCLVRPFFHRFHRVRLRVIMTLRVSPVLNDLLLCRFPTVNDGTVGNELLRIYVPFVRLCSDRFLLSEVMACLENLRRQYVAPIFDSYQASCPFRHAFLYPYQRLQARRGPAIIVVCPSVVRRRISFLAFGHGLYRVVLEVRCGLFPYNREDESSVVNGRQIVDLSVRRRLIRVDFPIEVRVSSVLRVKELFRNKPRHLIKGSSHPIIRGPQLTRRDKECRFRVGTRLTNGPLKR